MDRVLTFLSLLIWTAIVGTLGVMFGRTQAEILESEWEEAVLEVALTRSMLSLTRAELETCRATASD